METATARELRSRAAAILESVRKGNEVVITMRGKSIAVMKPLKETANPFSTIGFGIWRGRREMSNVRKWLRELRNDRHRR